MKNFKYIVIILSIVKSSFLFAQYDSIVGSLGCQAVNCNNSAILGWATTCNITRGCQDIATKAIFASFGDSTAAIGKASDVPTEAISLGDSGIAILTFDIPISNGNGYDLAVFENSLNDLFLELAFVEVSSDGIHYVRFPAVSNTQTTTQVGTFGNLNATLIHNLAGKYRAGWGTPFDLEELKDSTAININHITHVKIIDVIGVINSPYTSYDSQGNAVNDPYPTDFNSSGFDLTGVAVLNGWLPNQVQEVVKSKILIYPNPVTDLLNIELSLQDNSNSMIEISDITGKVVYTRSGLQNHLSFDVSFLKSGIYFAKIGNFITKVIKQ